MQSQCFSSSAAIPETCAAIITGDGLSNISDVIQMLIVMMWLRAVNTQKVGILKDYRISELASARPSVPSPLS